MAAFPELPRTPSTAIAQADVMLEKGASLIPGAHPTEIVMAEAALAQALYTRSIALSLLQLTALMQRRVGQEERRG